jgi:hypothetical protein
MLQSFCQEEKLRPVLSREEVTYYSVMKGSYTLFFLKKMMQPVLSREKLQFFLPKDYVSACSIQKRSYSLTYLEKKLNPFLPKEVAMCSIYRRKEVTAYKFYLEGKLQFFLPKENLGSRSI